MSNNMVPSPPSPLPCNSKILLGKGSPITSKVQVYSWKDKGALSVWSKHFRVSLFLSLYLDIKQVGEMILSIKYLPHKREDLSLSPQKLQKSKPESCVCKPIVPTVRWEAETGQSLELQGPASLIYVATYKRPPCQTKWKIKTQTEPHTHPCICPPIHKHPSTYIHTCTCTSFK